MPSPPLPEAVKRIFMEAFTARDIAEPLASFDAAAASGDVRAFMDANDFDVVGIREAGRVCGFIERGIAGEGTCGEIRRSLDQARVVSENVSLLTVLLELRDASFLLVTALGSVGGIITRGDIQKPAVRMWLFGIVTIVEIRFAQLIEAHCPGDSWKQFVSEGRQQKAQALLEERRRRHQDPQLIDCLQFSDKGQIIARNEDLRRRTVFATRGQAEEATKRLELLRNNLAHAQDIPVSDWDTIIGLCEFLAKQ
jgi:hypothetical protein